MATPSTGTGFHSFSLTVGWVGREAAPSDLLRSLPSPAGGGRQARRAPGAHRLIPGCRSPWQPPVERSAPAAQAARGHDWKHGKKRAARHCLLPFLICLTLAELPCQKGKASLKPGFYHHSSFGCQSYCHILQMWHLLC